MTDAIKQRIWDLVAPQIEAFERTGAHIERRLLEQEVEDIFTDIEDEMETNTLNAFHDGYHDGFMEAEDSISELQGQIQNVIEDLRDTAYKLEREYGR
jgi:hypothetical protein